MSTLKNLYALMLRGALAGASLAVVAPPSAVFADCKCNDDGTGSYKCNQAQTACVAGLEHCVTDCKDPEPPAPES